MPHPPAPRRLPSGESAELDCPGEHVLAGIILGLCWGLFGLCFGWFLVCRRSLQQNRLIELSLLVVGSHPDVARLCGRLAWTAFSRSARVAAGRNGAYGSRGTSLDGSAAGPRAILQ